MKQHVIKTIKVTVCNSVRDGESWQNGGIFFTLGIRPGWDILTLLTHVSPIPQWKHLPVCALRLSSTLSSCPPPVLCCRWTMRTLFVAVTLECSPPTMNHGDTHLVTLYHYAACTSDMHLQTIHTHVVFLKSQSHYSRYTNFTAATRGNAGFDL